MEKMSRKFWDAYSSLYGEHKCGSRPIKDSNPSYPTGKVKKSNVGSPIASEKHEQIVFVTWLRKNNIPAFHIPNGGSRNALEGLSLKRQGVEAGVPDVMVPIKRHGYGGLFIEMKRKKGGKLSEHQIRWRDILLSQGYSWHMANGAEEAIDFVKKYLG